ncbi:BSD domain-containing protein [Hirschfeldia incana]|nr:BSD domain-containing protein [Hirschfeldia incana]
MNFFTSVFSDDPDPPETESESEENPEQSNPNEDGGWSFGFGGLMKTIADRSESVIETYRRDLEEFGTGLKKEIEVAQGSLGTVGHAIDELGNTVMKGTAEIIAQGKEAILAAGDNESDSSSDNNNSIGSNRRDSFSSKPYSRFDAQVRAVQGDVSTYSEEGDEDSDEYRKWRAEFSIGDRSEEMEMLLEGNGEMRGVYKRVVPSVVDHETFWFRYFYKVYKLKQAEDLRANLVKRAALDDEEELSWDIDDDEETTSEKVAEDVSRLKLEGIDDTTVNDSVSEKSVKDDVTSAVAEVSNVGLNTETESEEKKETGSEKATESKTVADAAKQVVDAPPPASDETPVLDSGKKQEAVPESDESAPSQENSDKPDGAASSLAQGSGKPDGAASSTTQEEDLGWDEIEDMSSIDGKEASRTSGGSPNRAELRKRLSAAEEDEDLSWDIEDDDEESSKA